MINKLSLSSYELTFGVTVRDVCQERSSVSGLLVGMASHMSPMYPGAHFLHNTPVHLMLAQVHLPARE